MKNYLIKTLNAMAVGLFSSLIIGLILKQTGDLTGWKLMTIFGRTAQLLMGSAIGAAVAHAVGGGPLVVIASLATGAVGAGSIKIEEASVSIGIGEPMGAFVAAVIGAEIGRRVQGKTKLDIVLVPAVTIISGALAGTLIAPFVALMMKSLGMILNRATELQPIPMGIVLSVLMGVILTLPISSAALSIALGLEGLAAGAALVGCCCQMVGFAVISYRENKVGGLIAQGIGTSMIQIPNIIRNPKIWIPPTVASAILGPLSTAVFKMESSSIGAGMGTSGLVGQFATFSVMGKQALLPMLILHFLLPALLSLVIAELMRKKGHIRLGDMKLN
ncbi:MAG: PTS sugar transporter subunit IIC [Peptostreptococcaceae bacterium]|nr:PTS sugar transporter subunit IIC [Peptostreptococcaceae bacterium]